MPRPSRRDEVLEAALELFVQWGYEGTAISMVADAVGVSKATITYHFTSKEDLLVALAEPLLDDLDEVVPPRHQSPSWPIGVEELIDSYLDILLAHRDLAVWLEGDRAVLVNTAIGERLRDNHERMRAALVGRVPEPRARVAASIALGALWRPVRKEDIDDVNQYRDLLIQAALAPLRAVR